ncbi:polysaccharide export protein [Planktomarina temperata RCA23]|uniref:Polysaccharide export protein n=2 Tax=Planktomarina TaxID=1284657 RepID=A0AAN0RHH2_9RHOB|nr:polysaccharide export protein [Planktomarina temperata RCA23]
MKAEYIQKNCWAALGAFVVDFNRHKYVDNGSTQNLVGRSMKRAILVFIALTLTGCGIAYQPTSVRDDASANIRVVHLTPETVLEANSSPYTPQSWPTAFVSTDNLEEKNHKLQDPFFASQRLDGVMEWRMLEREPLTYMIGVGDVLTLNMQLKESLGDVLNGLMESQTSQRGFRVQDDGAISIPDIGRVVIGGSTLQEAESAVYQRLLEAGVSPSFSIEINEFNSQKISISGNVKSPGILPLTLQPLYLDEAIYESGGFTISDESFIIVRLYRNESIYQIFGPEIYKQNDTNRILLKDGDTIVVDVADEYDRILGLRQEARANRLEELEIQTRIKANNARTILSKMEYGSIAREYVYVIGEVLQQSRYTLPFEHKAVLADALLESGGGVSSLTGNPKQIYVLRGAADLKNFAPITALHLDTTNAANFLLATRLELRPKDVVFVGTQPITNWNRMIKQIIPSLGLPNINIPATK